MATIVTRAGKGSPLTNDEVDDNFINLNTELGGKLVASNNLSDLTNVATAQTNLQVDPAGTAVALAIALG
jgi:hypothetical protein